MTAGRLDRRIQFERATLTFDGLQNVETFAPHGAPLWASKADISDSERWRAGQVAANITTRFMVRWSPFTADITAKDRLTCDGVEYDLSGIKEGPGRRQWLEITASARADLSASPAAAWLLGAGVWNDSGVWIDAETWSDAA